MENTKYNDPIMKRLPRIKSLLDASRGFEADQMYERTLKSCLLLPEFMQAKMKDKDWKKLEDTVISAFKQNGWITILGQVIK